MPNQPPTRPSGGPRWEPITAPNCGWGLSPFWHPQQDRLYWVDRAQDRIWRLHLASGHCEMWQLGQTVGGIAACRSGALLMALRSGIHLSIEWRDIPQLIAPAPYDPQDQCFNEGHCDPWGRFWVGTRVDDGKRADGALYCLHKRDRPRPELRRLSGGVIESGGLAWSADGRTLYWGDSARGRIESHALPRAGQHPPVLDAAQGFASFPPGQAQGAAIDALGNYWIALADGACVQCLSPRGDLLASLPTPAQRPTALCFGAHDLRRLFLTTARAGLDAAALERYPDSGAVFALRVDTPGLPITPYED